MRKIEWRLQLEISLNLPKAIVRYMAIWLEVTRHLATCIRCRFTLLQKFSINALAIGQAPPVNQSTLTKPPSAELAPNQKDEDSLPPYEVLDEILRLHIENTMDADDIVNAGYDRSIVVDVLTRLERNEHKRWQMSPAPRVTGKAFGQGWRRP